jgi:hypothetical protein
MLQWINSLSDVSYLEYVLLQLYYPLSPIEGYVTCFAQLYINCGVRLKMIAPQPQSFSLFQMNNEIYILKNMLELLGITTLTDVIVSGSGCLY